jgi:uncharacterized membrane protein YhaH (DUF805 family)
MYKALAAIKYVAIEGAGRRRRSNPAAGASHTHLSHCPPIMLRGTRPQFVSIQPRQREFTMDFVQAIKSCLGQYATFSGRASRSEYWWFFLFQVLVMVATGMLGDVINGLASLALLLPALAVGTRRLHDIGRTGWWQLLLLTGIGFFVLLYWWVQPTDGASNIYGELPAA